MAKTMFKQDKIPYFFPCHVGSGERGENTAKKPVYNESTNECECIVSYLFPLSCWFWREREKHKQTNKQKHTMRVLMSAVSTNKGVN